MKKNILGVKVDDVGMNQALETVHKWLDGKSKHYIVTPNPEIIVASQKDLRYKSILNDADLSIPDGVGLKLSGKVQNTFAGVDFMEELIKHSYDWGFTVGLIGGQDNVAEKAANCLREKYPGVRIIYAESGGEVDSNGNVIARNVETKQSNSEIATPFGLAMTKKVDFLFVAFGPPKQEKWISANLDKLPVKVVMGVGGSFDYLSGVVPRAPLILRKLGLEWLFRLIIQPWRVKRQLALIKYLFMLVLNHDSN